jgi:hypothetical protein
VPDQTLAALVREELFPGNEAAFIALKKFCGSERITLFTGAGVSAPIFPTWTGLLEELLDEAIKKGLITSLQEREDYRDLLKNDPLELAEFIEQLFAKPAFRARLATIFRNPSSQFTDCHRLLSDVPSRGIVTLNYDNGHEIAHARKSRNPNTGKAQDISTLVRWIQSDVFNDEETPILHFHGDVSAPDQMVLTSSDYDQFYNQEKPDQFMRTLWTAHRILAVGFGFSDPFLTRVAERTLRSLPAETRHFAFIGREAGCLVTAVQRRMFAKKYRLEPVFYEVRRSEDGKQDHSDLKLLISELGMSATDCEQKSTAIVPPLQAKTVASPHEASVSERAFKSDLFVAPNGTTLYAEPRFTSSDLTKISITSDEVSVNDIVKATTSYVISCKPEYGATSLSRRLVLEFAGAGKRVLLGDASLLPNYKKKLSENFSQSPDHDGILVLDNFDVATNERLLKEIIGLNLFARIIILARQNLFETARASFSDQFKMPFVAVTLLHLSRADIRTLTKQYFETSDDDATSAIVEKIYVDLVTLCIPITPANVVMYLTILCKDNDFQPINRVQIVGRYLSEMLVGSSDAYRDAFSAKNKMDVISAFVFRRFGQGKTSFSEADWFSFCREHMKDTLTDFDDRSLLQLLKSKRVFVPIGSQFFFKYRFFFVFFLGRYIAGRPAVLADSIKENTYIKHKGLVEVLAELASDNEPLVTDITRRIKAALSEFDTRYIPGGFDPFMELEWPTQANEEEKIWRPLEKQLESGPRDPSEIDKLKSSVFGESRAADQQPVVQEFDRIERRLVTYHVALTEALSNSDNLSGEIKKEAVLTALAASFRYFQIGLLFASAIAERPFFYWNGLLFINEMHGLEQDKRKRTASVMFGLVSAVYDKNNEEVGSRKLGEVFKLFASSEEIVGFLRVLNFACLIRSKPRGWLAAAREMVAGTKRNEFYLSVFLQMAFQQFRNEVNTNLEREELKKLVAIIKMKRDLKKDHPGEKDIRNVVDRLEKKEFFDKKSATDDPEISGELLSSKNELISDQSNGAANQGAGCSD